MRKISTWFIHGGFFALSCISLHAQTPAKPTADPNTVNSLPTGQAPDEMTTKITDLFHAGKYIEAEKLAEGLLVAYPTDQRLIKAKELIDKLLAPASPANTTPSDNQPTSNGSSVQSRANMNSVQFAGMDRVEYNSLIELARQAQQTTDLEQQKASLQQFMERSSAFLQKHPDQMLLWQLRAASALILNDMMAGYEAGQRLLMAGAADSNDPNLQQLMTQLNLRRWLDKEKVEDLQKQQAEFSESEREKAKQEEFTFPVVHYLGIFVWDDDGYGHLTVNENDITYVGSDGTIRILRSDIREIQEIGKLQGVSFLGKKRNFRFAVVGEDAVANKKGDSLKPSTPLADAIAKRWKFVKTNDKLRPSPAAENFTPAGSPWAKPAAPAVQTFAPPLNNSAPAADAARSEYAARNAAFLNNPVPEPGVPADQAQPESTQLEEMRVGDLSRNSRESARVIAGQASVIILRDAEPVRSVT